MSEPIVILIVIVLLAVLIKVGRNQGGKRLNRRFETDKRTPMVGRRGERPSQRYGRNDPDHNLKYKEWEEYRSNLKVIGPWRSARPVLILLLVGAVIIFIGYYAGVHK